MHSSLFCFLVKGNQVLFCHSFVSLFHGGSTRLYVIRCFSDVTPTLYTLVLLSVYLRMSGEHELKASAA